MDSFQEKYNALVIKYNALLAENEDLKSILSQHGIVYSTIKCADESTAFSSIIYPPIKLSIDEKIALSVTFSRDEMMYLHDDGSAKPQKRVVINLSASTNGVEEYVTRKSINAQSVPTAILPR